jgi:hypothetical protein
LHDNEEVLQSRLLIWNSFEKCRKGVRQEKRECELDWELIKLSKYPRFKGNTYARLVRLLNSQQHTRKL